MEQLVRYLPEIAPAHTASEQRCHDVVLIVSDVVITFMQRGSDLMCRLEELRAGRERCYEIFE